MTKLKNPFMSFGARGKLGKWLRVLPRHGQDIAQVKAEPPDIKSLAQLSWRHMYQKAVALWHALSGAEKQEWESQARHRHMTGFAWFMSQALRPNPGLYLPLQGGTMSGEIDMATNKISAVPDPVVGQDADTKAARNAAIAAALAGSLHCDIYGYDGSNWQTLLVESSAQKNLRVKLYDGADGISSDLLTTTVFTRADFRGLAGFSMPLVMQSGAHARTIDSIALFGDGSAGLDAPAVGLVAKRGAVYDRLQTWSLGVLKVGRDRIDSTTTRKTSTGLVVGGVKYLYWIACSPDGPAAEWEISDATIPGQAIVYDHFDADKHSDHLNFDPPMKFNTGIYVEKFDHMKSIVFCYT